MRLFTKSQTYQSQIDSYPAGTFLETEAGYFFVFSDKVRYKFITRRVLDSWTPQRIVSAQESSRAVAKLAVLSKMKFRDGSLLYSHADGKMYLVSQRKLRHIKSPDVLDALNMKRSDAVWVSEREINLHEIGEPLNA